MHSSTSSSSVVASARITVTIADPLQASSMENPILAFAALLRQGWICLGLNSCVYTLTAERRRDDIQEGGGAALTGVEIWKCEWLLPLVSGYATLVR